MTTPAQPARGCRRLAQNLTGAALATSAVLLPLAPVAGPRGLKAAATPDFAAPPTAGGAPWSRSQLLEQLGVRAWHAHGRQGRGVKVAVLDAGFRGYRAHLGSALPPH